MKNKGVLVFVILSLLVVLSCATYIIFNDFDTPSKESPIVFEDKVFERSLKNFLGKEENDYIYKSELEPYVGVVIVADQVFLTNPSVTEKNIVLYSGEKYQIGTKMYDKSGTMTSLGDLKYFPNLNSLKVYFQKNIDYNSINMYSSINNLSLYADDVSDLTFVGRLVNLVYFNSSYNNINDLTPLGNLPKLKTAIMTYSDISNLNGIEKCTTLTNLQLDNNKIGDVNLLSGLSNLTYLSIQKNNITDVSPIKNLSKLENLYIKENPIANIDTLNTLAIIPE